MKSSLRTEVVHSVPLDNVPDSSSSPIPLHELRENVPELLAYFPFDVENAPRTRCVSVEQLGKAVRAHNEHQRQLAESTLERVELGNLALRDHHRWRVRWLGRLVTLLFVGCLCLGWWATRKRRPTTPMSVDEPATSTVKLHETKQKLRDGLEQIDATSAGLRKRLRENGGVFTVLDSPSQWQHHLHDNRVQLQKVGELRNQISLHLDPKLEQSFQRTLRALEEDQWTYQVTLRVQGLLDAKMLQGETFSPRQQQLAYAALFRDLKLDPLQDDLDSLVVKFEAFDLRELLAAAVEAWAALAKAGGDTATYDRLVAVAERVDPDSVKKHISDVEQLDTTVTSLLRDEEAFAKLSPKHVVWIGAALAHRDRDPVTWYRRAHRSHPSNFAIQFAFAETLAKTAPERAVSQYRAALAIRPESTVAWLGLAKALTRVGNNNDAVLVYEQISRRYPRNPRVWLGLAEVRERCRELSKQHLALRMIAEVAPTYAPGWRRLAEFLLEVKHAPVEAAYACQQARNLEPDNVDLFALSIETLFRQGKFAEARTQIETATKTQPSEAWNERLTKLTKRVDELCAQEQRFAEVLAGGTASVDERLTLANYASVYTNRHTEAQTLYESAFADDPTLFARGSTPFRYNAACCALLASQDPERSVGDKLHRFTQARTWLEAELAAIQEHIAESPTTSTEVIERLTWWCQDYDLQATRTSCHPDWLPEEEKAAWSAFWSRVNLIVTKASKREMQPPRAVRRPPPKTSSGNSL